MGLANKRSLHGMPRGPRGDAVTSPCAALCQPPAPSVSPRAPRSGQTRCGAHATGRAGGSADSCPWLPRGPGRAAHLMALLSFSYVMLLFFFFWPHSWATASERRNLNTPSCRSSHFRRPSLSSGWMRMSRMNSHRWVPLGAARPQVSAVAWPPASTRPRRPGAVPTGSPGGPTLTQHRRAPAPRLTEAWLGRHSDGDTLWCGHS